MTYNYIIGQAALDKSLHYFNWFLKKGMVAMVLSV